MTTIYWTALDGWSHSTVFETLDLARKFEVRIYDIALKIEMELENGKIEKEKGYEPETGKGVSEVSRFHASSEMASDGE